MLNLASGAWQLEAQPERGGAVTALWHRGREVLISPNPATADAIGAASFALVPYANRIAQGHLTHGGRQRTLPRNYASDLHPLHGTGWKRPWSVVAQEPDAIGLALEHTPDEHWPWAFTAAQRITLDADSVRFDLRATNTAAEAAPMGLGFHPAFTACAATRLRTSVDGVWLIDEDILPVSFAPADAVLPELPGAVPVLRSRLIDHCFTGWSRELHIDNGGFEGNMAISVSASPGMDFLHLYMPPGRNFFCAEPVSQMPDAIHHPGEQNGLRWLAPGESLQCWMRIAVRDAVHR